MIGRLSGRAFRQGAPRATITYGQCVLVDGYVRVSQVRGRGGERFISPDVQREQIEAWAKMRGALIGRIFEELDESGARADRPLLQEALGRIESGVSEGLVVAKLDRFGRSLVDSLAAIERICAADGLFVSVQDGLDLGTDSGRLVLRVMLSMAEFELDRVRTNWDTARARAIARGMHIGPIAPTGYRHTKSRRLVPDRKAGPLVTEIFRRRARGASLVDLACFLRDNDLPTTRGASAWRPAVVADIVRNRSYLGEVRCGEHVKRDAHQPLIDAPTWHQAQSPRGLAPRGERKPTLLAGVLRCSGCQMAMSGSTVTREHGRPLVYYACQGRDRSSTCAAPARIAGSLIESLIERAFFAELRRLGRRRPSTTEVIEAEASVATAEADLARYEANERLSLALGGDRFAAGVAKRARRVDRALLEVANAQLRAAGPDLPTADALAEAWPTMSVEERRAAITEAFDAIFIASGRLNVEERAAVCRRGEGPRDLPRPGMSGYRPHPFDPSACRRPPITHDASPPKPWTEARVRRELLAYLAGRDVIPCPEEFGAAGHAALYEQLRLHGGPARWGKLLGVGPGPQQHQPTWTPDWLQATLRVYLAGKEHFPSQAEFAAAGHAHLRRALAKHGGVAYWRGESESGPKSRDSRTCLARAQLATGLGRA